MPDLIDDTLRRRRRIHRRPAGARARRSRLPRPLRRRQRAGRAQRPRRDGRRGRAVRRAATGAGLPAAARLADPAVPGRVRRLHRRELRLPAVAADPAAGPAGRTRRLPALGPGGETVHHRSERLHRIFTFQALYAGVPPQRALAVYAVIAYMDTIAGVYFPRGGMRALPDALAAAATDAGVEFRYGATVSGLDRRDDRVRAVHTDRVSASTPTRWSSPPSCPTPIGCSVARRAGCCRCGRRRRRSSPTSAADRVTVKCRTTTSFSATPGSRRSATSSTTVW